MGQTTSTPASTGDAPTVSRQLENFFHVCNIIPDTPQHHRQQWTAPNIRTTTGTTATTTTPPVPSPASRHRRRRGGHSNGTSRRHGDHLSTTDYTTDDESDVYMGSRYHRDRPPRIRRHRHRRRTSNTYSDSDVSSVAGDELLREAPPTGASTRAPTATIPTTTVNATVEASAAPLPLTLDRRYDLDVAPSMVNMNLQWNGAYMVAALLYNEIAVKYGYRHLLSVQQLHWEAVRRYYQLPHIDSTGHYKVSLCALLDVVQSVALRSERELSVYVDLTEAHDNPHRSHHDPNHAHAHASHIPAASTTAIRMPTVSTTHRPFYQMQCYTVPADRDTLRAALVANHLVLCNLTLFSNFLSARRGVVPAPNRDDVPVGMVAITLVGYHADQDLWLVRFPFGLHWGEQGIGYITGSYLKAYNRDRWVVDVVECGEPPEYRRQREAEQADGVPGRLPVRLGSDEAVVHETVVPRQVTVEKKGGKSAQVRLRMI